VLRNFAVRFACPSLHQGSHLSPRRRRSSVTAALAALLFTTLIAGTLTTTSHPAAAATGKINIDAGGSGGTDVDGNSWLADKGFSGGTQKTTTATIGGTDYQTIFRSERNGMTSYALAVTNGSYWVKLLESEHTVTASGKRVFDVTSEGQLAADNLDVFAKAGGINKAVYVVFKTTVSDGTLNLAFKPSVSTAIVDGIVLEPITSTPSSPSTKVLWGMDDNSSYDSTEAGLGRKFTLVREYRRLDEPFVNSRMTNLSNSGHSLVMSVRAQLASGYLKYSAITAGTYDSTLLKGLAALNALKTRPFFIFQHEPDSTDARKSCSSSTSDSVCGPQFVAAWNHVYKLAKSHGYTRPIFAWTITSYGFNPQTNVRNNYFWVGTANTDWIGVDAYNGGCNQTWYGTFSQMMDLSIKWLKVHAPNKLIIMPEYGVTEGTSPTDKPNWYKAIPSALTQSGYSNIRALVYWNEAPGTKCSFKINTTTASYGSYKSLGLSSVMQAAAPT
jgi:hypothetical protein